jgi:cell division septum initiation protein DivIVA
VLCAEFGQYLLEENEKLKQSVGELSQQVASLSRAGFQKRLSSTSPTQSPNRSVATIATSSPGSSSPDIRRLRALSSGGHDDDAFEANVKRIVDDLHRKNRCG